MTTEPTIRLAFRRGHAADWPVGRRSWAAVPDSADRPSALGCLRSVARAVALDRSGAGIAAVDRDLRLILCNRTYGTYLASVCRRSVPLGADLDTTLKSIAREGARSLALWHSGLAGKSSREVWMNGDLETGGQLLEVSVAPLRVHGVVAGAIQIQRDLTERWRLERLCSDLQCRDRGTAGLVDALPDGVFRLDSEGRYTYVSPALERFTGLAGAAMLGRSGREVAEAHPQPLCERIDQACRTVIESGRPVEFEAVFDGRWYRGRLHRLSGAEGGPESVLGVVEDITDRKEAETYRELLTAELNHRVKNTLAIVQSIAARMLVGGDDLYTAYRSFEARLCALGEAHRLLAERRWEGVRLNDLVIGTFRPFGCNRCSIAGADLVLNPRISLTLGMVFHELATNAAKYGSLSAPEGTVAVSWAVEGEGDQATLTLIWSERGGPQVPPPVRTGFGRMLIERGIQYELKGEAHLHFEEHGLVCRLRLPLSLAVLPH